MIPLLAVVWALSGGPDQEPSDARSLLEQHLRWQQASMQHRASEHAILEQVRSYYRAGAEGELRQELEKLERHPEAMRYAMLADCWQPQNYSQGLQRSRAWMVDFPSQDPARRASVEAVESYLEEQLGRREEVEGSRLQSLGWCLIGLFGVVFGLRAGGQRWP